MNNSRLWIAASVALIIIFGGIYWNQQSTQKSQVTSENQKQTEKKELAINEKDWEVTPEARISLSESATTSETSPYDTFKIPGQLTFPQTSNPEKVKLQVKIRPVSADRAKELGNSNSDNPLKSLFKDGPESVLNKDMITKNITTDKNGRFSITEAVPGIYGIQVADTNWTIKDESPNIELASKVTPLRYELRQQARLTGKVVNENGDPLQATIAFMDGSRKVKADESGQFSVSSIEPGEPVDYLMIQNKGYLSHFVSLSPPDPGETLQEKFTLEKAAGLEIAVQTESGDPVTEGKIILERADDKHIKYGAQQNIPHGEGKIASLDKNGIAEFPALMPGKVRFGLTFSNFLSKKKTVSVQEGKTTEVDYAVSPGEPFQISYINESTGEPAEDIRPVVKVLDENDNLLEPGMEFKGQPKPGVYEAAIDPNFQKLKVRVTSPRKSFKSKTKTFPRSAFPNLEMQLVPKEKTGPPAKPTPPGLVKLKLRQQGAKVDWSSIENANLFVIDKNSGNRVHARTGGQSVFNERIPLENGSYVIYGQLLSKTGPDLVTHKEIEISSQKPGVRQLEAHEEASIKSRVSIQGIDSFKGLEAGISLITDNQENVESSKIYYPDSLRTSIDSDGSFQLENIPPEKETTLHIMISGQSPLDQSRGTVLSTKPIAALTPGSSRSVSTISINSK